MLVSNEVEDAMAEQIDRVSQILWGMLALLGAVLAIVGIYRYVGF